MLSWKNMRAQSAMEYLMTYGWSILIIAIVLAALFSLGVFSNSNLGPRAQPNSCRVYRPNGPGTTTNINLEGVCNGELPKYVAQFNGASSYVNIPYSPALQSGTVYTVSAWIKTGSSAEQQIYITTGGGGDYYVGVDWSGTSGYVSAVGSTGSITTSKSVDDGNWHLVVAVFNGASSDVYIDGVSAVTGSTSGYASGTFSTIGAYNYGSGVDDFFNGQIANIQVYNTSLDSVAVNALYLEGIGGAPVEPRNLVAWWPLNGDVNDYSGNNNNGAATSLTFTSVWTSGYTTP